MLMGDNAGNGVLGPTPLQTFKGSNFSGVPQPKLFNDSKAHDYSAEATTSPNEHQHIIVTAIIFIVVAYVIWHWMYEK